MTILSYSDILMPIPVILIACFFCFGVKYDWISTNKLFLFIVCKITVSIGFNVWAASINMTYDAFGYYFAGKEYARMFGDLVAFRSTEYLTTNPFFWVDGLSTDRLSSFAGLLLAITGESFIASSLIMCLFGAIGQLLIYKQLRRRFPNTKQSCFDVVLFLPSLTLWSSSILKDTIGIFAVGLIFSNFSEALIRFKLRNLALAVIGLYLLFLFRSYLILMIGGLVLFAVWDQRIDDSKSRIGIWKYLILFSAVVTALLAAGYYIKNHHEFWLEMQNGNDLVYDSLEAGSTFTNAQLELSFGGALALPIGVVNSLMRPFIWEVGSPLQVFAALETLAMNIFVIGGVFNYIFILPENSRRQCRNIVIGFLIISIIMGCGVGLFSSNLGTISRYRIPILPFLLAGPCVIYSLRAQSGSQKQLARDNMMGSSLFPVGKGKARVKVAG